MNGFHTRGYGISAHERVSTTVKKIANSTVGKIIRSQARSSRLRGTVATVPAGPGLSPGPALACDAGQHLGAHRKPAHGRAPLAVGDSVMLGAADRLAGVGFEGDARGCRQMGQGAALLPGGRAAR